MKYLEEKTYQAQRAGRTAVVQPEARSIFFFPINVHSKVDEVSLMPMDPSST